MGKNRGFENPYRNEEYIQSILQRFPEFNTKNRAEIVNLLNNNIDLLERSCKYTVLDQASKEIQPLFENNIDTKNENYISLFESIIQSNSCIHDYNATVDYINEEVWIVELNCTNSDWNFQKTVPILIFTELGHNLKTEQTYNIKIINNGESIETNVNLIKDAPTQKDLDELYNNKKYRGLKDSKIWRSPKE